MERHANEFGTNEENAAVKDGAATGIADSADGKQQSAATNKMADDADKTDEALPDENAHVSTKKRSHSGRSLSDDETKKSKKRSRVDSPGFPASASQTNVNVSGMLCLVV